jgi:hypothetical protein
MTMMYVFMCIGEKAFASPDINDMKALANELIQLQLEASVGRLTVIIFITRHVYVYAINSVVHKIFKKIYANYILHLTKVLDCY